MNYYLYGITMKTSGGKTLYLKCSSRETADPYKVLMDWSFNKEATCLWESYEDCEKFAKKYFKNFSNYSISLFGINNSLRTVDMGVAI